MTNNPIIEVYEYKIFNCEEKGLNSYRLKPIGNIPGKINAYGGIISDIYSRDVIGEKEGDFKYNKKFMKNFEFSDNILKNIYYFYNLYSIFTVRKTKKFGKLWKNLVNINFLINLLKECSPNFELTNEQTYIYKKRTNKNVIVFGDIHGSFHTVFRQLLRLHKFGVLNIYEFKINPEYIIIFLGDIVDRGLYSLEVILIVLLLIKNNPDQVIYNRGNHEEFITNLNGGLMNEIKLKVSEDKQELLFQSINEFFNKLPSSVYLKINNSSFYLSHGGFSKHELAGDEYKCLFDCDKDIYRITDKDFFENMDVKESHGGFIRWSDFTFDQNRCPNRGYSDALNCINKEDVVDFLSHTKCDFIIRGHQDSGGNYITSNQETTTPYYQFFGSILSENLNKFNTGVVYNTNSLEREPNAKNGSICRINVNEFNRNSYSCEEIELLPVLTTSTNTDINRPLCKDSFVLIRMSNNIENFSDSLGFDLSKLIDLPNFDELI